MHQGIKLWGRATSVNVQKAAWVIAELDLPCERIDAGGAFGGLNDPAYIALNPNRRVPTLIDGDLVLWESNAICRYLGQAYGRADMFDPSNAKAQGQADMWMEWFQNNVYANFIALFYQAVRLPPSQRDAKSRSAALDGLCRALEIFDAALADREFICGDRLSLGDIPTGSCLYRFFTMDIERPSLPNIERYYETLTQRKTYHDTVMVDYSSLRGVD
ncbi:glutathione S-transferase family protein [Planktotalea sp.]|uniref:glutathione S-transferase family protein n=1 Tax=Planktotalea sp. TaxID=2029877 RepID=UPI0032988EB1